MNAKDKPRPQGADDQPPPPPAAAEPDQVQPDQTPPEGAAPVPAAETAAPDESAAARDAGSTAGVGEAASEDQFEDAGDEDAGDEDTEEDADEEYEIDVQVAPIPDRPEWREVTVVIGQEVVDAQFKDVYDELRQNAAVRGFRPGKAPPSVLRARFGRAAQSDIAQQLLLANLERALDQLDFRTTGEPEIDADALQVEEGQPFRFAFKVEAMPEVVLGSYRGVEVVRPRVEVTDAMVQQALQGLRDQRAEFAVAESRPVAKGDFLVLSLEARDAVTGETLFEPSESEVTVGSNETLPDTGFEEALEGLTAGETKTIPLEFADDYRLAAFAGKRIEFKVAVKEIKTRLVPELNDEFARDVGPAFESMDDLRKAMRERLVQTETRRADEVMDRAIQEKIGSGSPFTPPESMVARRARAMIGRELEGLEPEQLQGLTAVAADQVKRELLLARIAEVEKLEVDEDQVDQAVALASVRERKSQDEIRSDWEESGQLAGLRSRILEKMVMSFLRENAHVTEGPPLAEGAAHAGHDHGPAHDHPGHDLADHEHEAPGHEHADHGHEGHEHPGGNA